MKKRLALVIALSMGLGTTTYAETTDEKIKRLEAELNSLADIIEKQQESSASEVSQTKIGGYGELHYNNLQTDAGTRKKELDFHRFVITFAHEFSEKTRFNSELEFEHFGVLEAGEGSGEVELEQAYIEHDIAANTSIKAGIMLIPIGILNDTHELTTFYGVERNLVEKNIIPSTWWGAGASVSGHFPNGLSYDAMLHEGLDVPDTFNIRSGVKREGKQMQRI